jgi:hypothetical protein
MAKNRKGQNSNSFTFDFDNMSAEDIEKAALEQMGGDEDLENDIKIRPKKSMTKMT